MSSVKTDDCTIRDVAELRRTYPPPMERSVLKSLKHVDSHMRSFIALSPLVCIGSCGDNGADVAPRGDAPGFVHVLDEVTLLIPDWPGNNRLDALTNIVSDPRVGLLFFIPGFDETLRVNGVATISVDPALTRRWDVNGKHPRSVLRVSVREAFLHCGKALIRSRLWKDDYKVERSRLPSYGQMLKDQTKLPQTTEQFEAIVAESYRDRLY
jgi:uncharacterized protein